jgi:antirestriction protein ArdC
MTALRSDVYFRVADQIIAELEASVPPTTCTHCSPSLFTLPPEARHRAGAASRNP